MVTCSRECRVTRAFLSHNLEHAVSKFTSTHHLTLPFVSIFSFYIKRTFYVNVTGSWSTSFTDFTIINTMAKSCRISPTGKFRISKLKHRESRLVGPTGQLRLLSLTTWVWSPDPTLWRGLQTPAQVVFWPLLMSIAQETLPTLIN